MNTPPPSHTLCPSKGITAGTSVFWSNHGQVYAGLVHGVTEGFARVSVAVRGERHDERAEKLIPLEDIALTRTAAWDLGALHCTREYWKWWERARFCRNQAEAAAKNAEPVRMENTGALPTPATTSTSQDA